MRKARTLATAACVLGGAACANEAPAPWSSSETDSADVVIVQNTGRMPPESVWTTESRLTIGEVEGPAEYTFGLVEDVTMDGMGRVFVLDRAAQSVVVYEPDGSFAYRFAGPGEGPGELGAYATQIRLGPSDSVSVMDNWAFRLNVYARDGTPARTVPMRFGRRGPYRFHWLTDGGLLVRWFTYNTDENGRFVPWDGLLRWDPSVEVWDTLLTFGYEPSDLGGIDEIRRPLITNGAFHDVLSDGRIVWGAALGDQVAIHDAAGRLRRLVRHEGWMGHPMTDAERDSLERAYRTSRDDPGAPLPDNRGYPTRLPTITDVRATPDGGFWVRRMGRVDAVHPAVFESPAYNEWLSGTTWERYDGDGRWLGSVTVPERFRLTRVVGPSVVGVRRDDLDVERVMVLEVRRE